MPVRHAIEAIAEVFNLFNAKNPFIPLTTRRREATGAPLTVVHAADGVCRRLPDSPNSASARSDSGLPSEAGYRLPTTDYRRGEAGSR